MNHRITRALVVILLFIGTANPVRSQDAEPKETATPTKLVQLQSRKGASLALGQENVGAVGELSEGVPRVSVDVIEIRELAANIRANGLIISVNEQTSNALEVLNELATRRTLGRIPETTVESWTGAVFVDEAEIESLLTGLDYVLKGEPSTSKLATWEVRYETEGFFRVSSYGIAGGDTAYRLVTTGSPKAEASLSKKELEQFKALLLKAQKRLETLKE